MTKVSNKIETKHKEAVAILYDSVQIDVDRRVLQFGKEAAQCIELYAKKNHDYGDSFSKGMKEIGNAYGVGRIFDKINRLIALCGKEEESKVKDESYDDTLRDLACYSLMMLAYRHRNNNE